MFIYIVQTLSWPVQKRHLRLAISLDVPKAIIGWLQWQRFHIKEAKAVKQRAQSQRAVQAYDPSTRFHDQSAQTPSGGGQGYGHPGWPADDETDTAQPAALDTRLFDTSDMYGVAARPGGGPSGSTSHVLTPHISEVHEIDWSMGDNQDPSAVDADFFASYPVTPSANTADSEGWVWIQSQDSPPQGARMGTGADGGDSLALLSGPGGGQGSSSPLLMGHGPPSPLHPYRSVQEDDGGRRGTVQPVAAPPAPWQQWIDEHNPPRYQHQHQHPHHHQHRQPGRATPNLSPVRSPLKQRSPPHAHMMRVDHDPRYDPYTGRLDDAAPRSSPPQQPKRAQHHRTPGQSHRQQQARTGGGAHASTARKTSDDASNSEMAGLWVPPPALPRRTASDGAVLHSLGSAADSQPLGGRTHRQAGRADRSGSESDSRSGLPGRSSGRGSPRRSYLRAELRAARQFADAGSGEEAMVGRPPAVHPERDPALRARRRRAEQLAAAHQQPAVKTRVRPGR